MGTLARKDDNIRLSGAKSRVYALTGVNLAIQSPPLRWVLVLGLHVFEGDGEVDEVQVEVVDAPELELVLGDLLRNGLFVEGIPEL